MNSHDKLLSSIEIETSTPVKSSIIWLHGLGADGSDFVPMAEQVPFAKTFGIRFIFPSAPIIPVTINNGYQMRAWFDIVSLHEPIHDVIGIKRSGLEVSKLIQREVERGIDPNKIILAGFSQGAVIAMATGLLHTPPLGGVIALSGYLVLSKEQLQSASQTPLFLAHGKEDPTVPYIYGLRSYEKLCEAQYPVTWKTYHMGHGVCAEEVQDINAWLKQIYGISNES